MLHSRWSSTVMGMLVVALALFFGSTSSVRAMETSAAASPPSPKHVVATPAGDHIVLTWDAAAGATSYTIYRGTTPGGEEQYLPGIITTTFANTKVTQGTTYYYQVTAVGPGGESARSNEAGSSLTAPVSTPTPPPQKPVTTKTPHVDMGKIVLWFFLGAISLALLGVGISMFQRQQRLGVPFTYFGLAAGAQPIDRDAPTSKTPAQFAPRAWDELSPAERTGITGVIGTNEPVEPDMLPPARGFGAVAFWDEEEPPAPITDPTSKHVFRYPNPVWPPDRGTLPLNQEQHRPRE